VCKLDSLYSLSPEDYLKLDITSLPPEDLKELAYYLWCCYEEDELLMDWRTKILLPIVNKFCTASVEEVEDLDGE
jgi:hypothetical protein